MKLLLTSAALVALTGSAFAYQTTPEMDVGVDTTATMTTSGATFSVDPNVAIAPPATWTAEQRTLWDEHLAFYPTTWTEDQRAAFQAMRGIPPVSWTPEQRILHEQHMVSLPTTWTPEQRAMYEQQIVIFRTPWMSGTQSAAVGTTATTSFAAAPASGPLSQPDNSNPERDARGIAVISDAAVVPAGFNGVAATAMGGPLVDATTGEAVGADDSYPACTATVTDNCIQLYERGVRDSLASWSRPTVGADTTTTTAVGGPYDPADKPEDDVVDVDTQPDGDLDVDGDLDGDGDNDL